MHAEERPIYLDYNASTPVDPRVYAAMSPWFIGAPSNSGSRTHVFGQRARDAVEEAREQVAAVLGMGSEEVYFTSGATESDNLAILGLRGLGEKVNRKHVLTTKIEHKAVLEPVELLRKEGFDVELLPVCSDGYVELETVRSRLRQDTLLVSVMHANNETGVLQPVQEIGDLLDGTDTFFHVDAAQTFGKEFEGLRSIPCDFISMSSHKIYGPQGVGALSVRRRRASRRPLEPLLFGGGQERGFRPGTLPVPLIVGFGAAAELAGREHQERNSAARLVKNRLLSGLQQVEHRLNGDQSVAQPYVLNVSFPGVDSEALMMAIKDDMAISNGSACTSASYDPSHVLLAMGFDEDRISESVRISWGPGVEAIPVNVLVSAVKRMRIDS